MPLVSPAVRAPEASRLDIRTLVACVAAAFLGGIVYVNALHNPFVYDDYHTVVANRSIQGPTSLRSMVLHDITRPVVNVSYGLDRVVWGDRPFGFHVTNVLLHMLNVVLLFQFARRLEEDRSPPDGAESGSSGRVRLASFAAAALFAVHPMMTEAVGYISGRSEVLCATFFLLAMLSGRRWLRGGGAPWAALTIGLWIVALASKEPAAMFPFVLLAYDWLAVAGDAGARRRRLLTVHLPLVGFAVAAGLLRLAVLVRVEYPGQATAHWSYILLELDVVRRYVGMLLYPVGQSMFHEVTAIRSVFDPRVGVGVAVVGALAALVWILRRFESTMSLGIAWFLLLLVPSSVLILFDQGEPMTEHRVYLASCGVFLAAGGGLAWASAWLDRVGARPRALVPIVLAVVVWSFGAETRFRNVVWASPVTLWRESVDLAPTHFRPRLLLGEALQDEGRNREALEEFETAVRLRPTEPTTHVMLGRSLAELGRFDEARQQLRRALEIDPRNEQARRSLAVLEALHLQSRQP